MNKHIPPELHARGTSSIMKWRGWQFVISNQEINKLLFGSYVGVSFTSYDMPHAVKNAIALWLKSDFADLDLFEYLDKMFPPEIKR